MKTTLFILLVSTLVALGQYKADNIAVGTATAASMIQGDGMYNVYTNASGQLVTNWWGKHGGFGGHDYFGNFYSFRTNGMFVYSNAASRVTLRLWTTNTGVYTTAMGDNSQGNIFLGTNGVVSGNGNGLTNLNAANLTGSGNGAIFTNLTPTLWIPFMNPAGTIAFSSGAYWCPEGGTTASLNQTEVKARANLGWSGNLIGMDIEVSAGGSSLGVGTNLVASVFTNGIQCGASAVTLLGNGTQNIVYQTNVVFSSPIPIVGTNWDLMISNTAATTTSTFNWAKAKVLVQNASGSNIP